jgi:heptose I phosphotransferase
MAGDYVEHNGLLVHRDYLEVLRGAGLDSFDALLAVSGEANLKKKGLASWRERIPLGMGTAGENSADTAGSGSGGRAFFLKRYTRPPLKEQLRQRLAGFPATAAMEWRWLRRAKELGIAAPIVVAYGLRRRGIIESNSVILTAKVPGISLEKWVPANVAGLLRDRAFKRILIAAVADLVAKLHGAGLFHRDLYLAHLFLDGDPASPRLTMIDLQRVIRPRVFVRRWRVKDLASLNYSTPRAAATNADRLRWYKRYRGVERLMSADRALIRAVAAKTQRIARHSAKHRLGR